jgi:hypothetical protein
METSSLMFDDIDILGGVLVNIVFSRTEIKRISYIIRIVHKEQ